MRPYPRVPPKVLCESLCALCVFAVNHFAGIPEDSCIPAHEFPSLFWLPIFPVAGLWPEALLWNKEPMSKRHGDACPIRGPRRFFLRQPVRAKIAAAMLAVTLLACLVTAGFVYPPLRRTTRERIRRSLVASAATAAMLVEPEEHARLRPGDEETPLYRKIKTKLLLFKASNPDISEVYTMVPGASPNSLRFGVDASFPEDDDDNGKLTPDELPAKIGEDYDISRFPQMREAFLHPTADAEPSADKWGTWLSAYAPIRDEAGKAVAILGVDMSLEELRTQERSAGLALLAAALLAATVATAAALVMARKLAAPLEALMQAAREVRGGNLDFRVSLSQHDEFGRLGEAFDEMVDSLSRDGSTGLYSRAYFRERLRQEIARAGRQSNTFCVAVLDLDGFKAINDSLGHAAGDAVLQEAAACLKESVRTYDIIARIGGDEFAIMLPDTDCPHAVKAARRALKALSNSHITAAPAEGEERFLTASAGIACFPSSGADPDALLLAADLAMLRSKRMARGSVSCYSDPVVRATVGGPADSESLFQRTTWSVLETLAAIVDSRSQQVRVHSEFVARYAAAVAKKMGLAPALIDQAKTTGLLHDIGHIAVPDAILCKTGKLSRQEWEIVRTHPVVGATMLSKIPHLQPLADAIRHHHEHLDGSGYPDGLRGEEIPLLARVLCAVDSYEAMTSSRIYRQDRPVLSPQEALQEMRSLAGRQFDAAVVEALEQVIQEEPPKLPLEEGRPAPELAACGCSGDSSSPLGAGG